MRKNFRQRMLASVLTAALSLTVLSAPAVTVSAATASTSLGQFSMEGYATVQNVTGGGIQKEDSSNYYKVGNASEFLKALTSAKKLKKPAVIELTNDIALGSKEIGSALSTYSGVIQEAANQPLLHPTLLQTGVSTVHIKDMSDLTIFSENGSKITHACFNLSRATNVIIRNITFDEIWEWDENTSGDYDRNDWDYVTVQNSSTGIWIDHCTFYKAYDGIVDVKKAASTETTDVTVSYSKFLPASEGDFFDAMMSKLEANPLAYPYYYSLISKYGMTKEQVRGYAYGQKKVHLIGASDTEANTKNLRVTLANNLYKDCNDRLPRMRAGYAHVYNCVMDSEYIYKIRNTIKNSTAKSKIVSNGAISTVGAQVFLQNTDIKGIMNPLLSGNGNSSVGAIGAMDTNYSLGGVQKDLNIMAKNGSTLTVNANEFLKNLPYENVRLYDQNTLETTVLPYAGSGAITMNDADWMATSYADEAPEVKPEVKPEEKPEVSVSSYAHDFTAQNLVSDFFTIKGGLSTSKGTVVYNGKTYKTALKMESATKVSFITDKNSKLTLVANSDCNKNIIINNKTYTFTNGVLEVELSAGNCEIVKADSNVNLYYMEVSC